MRVKFLKPTFVVDRSYDPGHCADVDEQFAKDNLFPSGSARPAAAGDDEDADESGPDSTEPEKPTEPKKPAARTKKPKKGAADGDAAGDAGND